MANRVCSPSPARMALTWRLSFQVDCRKAIIKKYSRIIPNYTGTQADFAISAFTKSKRQLPAVFERLAVVRGIWKRMQRLAGIRQKEKASSVHVLLHVL